MTECIFKAASIITTVLWWVCPSTKQSELRLSAQLAWHLVPWLVGTPFSYRRERPALNDTLTAKSPSEWQCGERWAHLQLSNCWKKNIKTSGENNTEWFLWVGTARFTKTLTTTAGWITGSSFSVWRRGGVYFFSFGLFLQKSLYG